jgi:hypothetical protein
MESKTTFPCLQIINQTLGLLLAPPLEYIASLHSKNQEISGRQIWTGSLTLAYYVLTEPKVREQLVGKR